MNSSANDYTANSMSSETLRNGQEEWVALSSTRAAAAEGQSLPECQPLTVQSSAAALLPLSSAEVVPLPWGTWMPRRQRKRKGHRRSPR